jgi:hypothetical protein
MKIGQRVRIIHPTKPPETGVVVECSDGDCYWVALDIDPDCHLFVVIEDTPLQPI